MSFRRLIPGADAELSLTEVSTDQYVIEAVRAALLNKLFPGATANTTDATVTTLQSIGLNASKTTFIRAIVRARRTGGASGTAEDGAIFVLEAAFKMVAGAATQIETTTGNGKADQPAWACVFDVTGGSARIRVTGASGNNITWRSNCEIWEN